MGPTAVFELSGFEKPTFELPKFDCTCLKTDLIFEVLHLFSAVYGTDSVVQTINKYPLYGHLLPMKEKHLGKSFSSDLPIIAKASCLPSSE